MPDTKDQRPRRDPSSDRREKGGGSEPQSLQTARWGFTDFRPQSTKDRGPDIANAARTPAGRAATFIAACFPGSERASEPQQRPFGGGETLFLEKGREGGTWGHAGLFPHTVDSQGRSQGGAPHGATRSGLALAGTEEAV